MRRLATGLLLFMAALFLIGRLLQPRYPWLSFVTAFAEAAMVGALADWFAVTALFRHPLGLPIPHTAIIPSNKDRIGVSVAEFLEHNFMTREVLVEELKHIDFAGSAARWLAQPDNSRAVALQLTGGLPTVIRMAEDEDIANFLQTTLASGLKNLRFAPLLAEVLALLIEDRRHQLLFDHLIGMAAKALDQNKGYIREKIHEKSPKWLPRIIDEKIYEKLVGETQNILDEMREEGSEWRERFQQSAEDFIVRLRTAPEYEERIAGVIDRSLNHPLFRDYVQTVWRDVRNRVLADVESPQSRIAAQAERALAGLGAQLAADDTVQAKLNAWIRDFAADAIASRRQVIAGLVERVIRKWDAETVSRKFELYVGKDLQYIRINGTVVGGLVGLVLHVVTLVI
ncbi:DUF445 domain-containing protein [Noviherbaspirillum sp. DKR-6]|uniref:DUF445 domain-containing protein n=2 Tax=Noviherbaspirillum pedocola TaxID=2801341 RepID=A0A934W5K9_9BURK|nr:DUF445 domain-containing protein [Noviherbaspirillum pedocola]